MERLAVALTDGLPGRQGPRDGPAGPRARRLGAGLRSGRRHRLHEPVTMTGHASQVFSRDDDWLQALHHARRALRPGGQVAFDRHTPHVHGWQAWNPTDSRRSVVTESDRAEVWREVTNIDGQLVSFDTTTRYAHSGHVEVDTDVLRFRDEPALRASLPLGGFVVEHVHGDWDASPARATSRELIVTAVRAD